MVLKLRTQRSRIIKQLYLILFYKKHVSIENVCARITTTPSWAAKHNYFANYHFLFFLFSRLKQLQLSLLCLSSWLTLAPLKSWQKQQPQQTKKVPFSCKDNTNETAATPVTNIFLCVLIPPSTASTGRRVARLLFLFLLLLLLVLVSVVYFVFLLGSWFLGFFTNYQFLLRCTLASSAFWSWYFWCYCWSSRCFCLSLTCQWFQCWW